jgi:putative ABC transport system ATP-binding protein
MAHIVLKDVSKIYGKENAKVEALRKINLTINSGEMVAIMGPSGSGKSTLLNIIGCLNSATTGDYYLEGEEIKNYSEKKLANIRNKAFGFIVQYFGLLDDYTSYENNQIPLEYAKVSRKKRKVLITDIMDKLGIRDKMDKYPTELSGGQNQRVAIARALVNNPNTILADEPTGALDRKTSQEVMDILKSLNNEGKTIIVVTHDEKVAANCKRIICMEDGKIISDKRIKEEVNE